MPKELHSSNRYRPLQAAVYLVVAKEQNWDLLKELKFSIASLHRFHPGLPVFVYHQNLDRDQLGEVLSIPGVLDFPIAADHTGRFAQFGHRKIETKVLFPELNIIAAKIDVLLLSPGDSLLLDTDTEVVAPLDECFKSSDPWMHYSEGPVAEHERDFGFCLKDFDWAAWGWPGGIEQYQVFNSGVLWVPQGLKQHVLQAKELLWYLAEIPSDQRDTNRLDEQLSLSIAMQGIPDHQVHEFGDRVNHYWEEKYSRRGPTYDRVYGPGGNTLPPLKLGTFYVPMVPGKVCEAREKARSS